MYQLNYPEIQAVLDHLVNRHFKSWIGARSVSKILSSVIGTCIYLYNSDSHIQKLSSERNVDITKFLRELIMENNGCLFQIQFPNCRISHWWLRMLDGEQYRIFNGGYDITYSMFTWELQGFLLWGHAHYVGKKTER